MAWINDRDYALGQVDYVELDAAGVVPGTRRLLSTVSWPYRAPRIIATTAGFLVGYIGAVEGKTRLYVTHIE